MLDMIIQIVSSLLILTIIILIFTFPSRLKKSRKALDAKLDRIEKLVKDNKN